MPGRTTRSDAKPAREYAGVLTAFIVVIAYVGIGFSTMMAQLIFGVEVSLPEDWRSAMLSLASAALGYLIGKKIEATGGDDDGYSEAAYRAALYRAPPNVPCPTCGQCIDTSVSVAEPGNAPQ